MVRKVDAFTLPAFVLDLTVARAVEALAMAWTIGVAVSAGQLIQFFHIAQDWRQPPAPLSNTQGETGTGRAYYAIYASHDFWQMLEALLPKWRSKFIMLPTGSKEVRFRCFLKKAKNYNKKNQRFMSDEACEAARGSKIPPEMVLVIS